MTPAWAQRREALLSDCLVSPNIFHQMLDRLGEFVVPYQRAPGGRGWTDAAGWDGVKWLYFSSTPTVWPVRRAFTHAVAQGMMV